MHDKTILAKGMGVSIAVVALVGLVVLSTGAAYAAPLAGAGGFTVEADEIRSDDFLLYPGVGESSEAESTPVVVVEQRNVEIDGLVLTKEQSVEALPGLSGTVEISFTADETVEADQQYIKMTGQTAENADFQGQVINDQYSDDPQEQFQQSSGGNAEPEDGFITDIEGDTPGVVLEDPEIQMVYLASNEISLPGLEVDLEYNPDEEPDNSPDGDTDADNGESQDTDDNEESEDANDGESDGESDTGNETEESDGGSEDTADGNESDTGNETEESDGDSN